MCPKSKGLSGVNPFHDPGSPITLNSGLPAYFSQTCPKPSCARLGHGKRSVRITTIPVSIDFFRLLMQLPFLSTACVREITQIINLKLDTYLVRVKWSRGKSENLSLIIRFSRRQQPAPALVFGYRLSSLRGPKMENRHDLSILVLCWCGSHRDKLPRG